MASAKMKDMVTTGHGVVARFFQNSSSSISSSPVIVTSLKLLLAIMLLMAVLGATHYSLQYGQHGPYRLQDTGVSQMCGFKSALRDVCASRSMLEMLCAHMFLS